MLSKLIVKFIKARWGDILPAIFKAIAEGKFGEPLKKLYWFLAGYKTSIGVILWAAGAGLESVCSNYPEMAWACVAAPYVFWVGAFLTGVGLADGGTRNPWPSGTPKSPDFS